MEQQTTVLGGRRGPRGADIAASVRGTAAASLPEPGDWEPCLAERADIVPPGREWLHELELVGIRMMLHKDGRELRFTGPGGDDWSPELAGLADAAREIAADRIVLDGELIALGGEGRADRETLREELAHGDGATCHLVAFDVLYVEGWDVRGAALVDRKTLLRETIGTGGRIRAVDYVVGSGPAFYEHACAAGAPGVVSKRASSRYASGKSDDWRVVRCTKLHAK